MIRTTGGTAAQQRVNAQQQIEVRNEQFNATHAGSLTALVRVGTDGKPGSQIRVLAVTNPSAMQNLGDRIGSCRFVPARVLGVVVPAQFRYTMGNAGIVR